MEPQLVTYHDPDLDIQRPFDVAVIIASMTRPSLVEAVRSVFAQDIKGTVQILIGIDQVSEEGFDWDALLKERPANMAVTVFWPGYSTSTKNGGIHSAVSGGSLRSLLSFLANSRYVAYLDDDNWFSPHHLSSLRETIDGKAWAYSRRWFVDAEDKSVVCEDSWESVGPDQGVFADNFGGFVDTNCYMIDTLTCAPHLSAWSVALNNDPKGRGSDRSLFNRLMQARPTGDTKTPSICYTIHKTDTNHQARHEFIQNHHIGTGVETCPDWQPAPDKLPNRQKKHVLSGTYRMLGDHSRQFDIAVVIPTIGRIDLLKTIHSISKQHFDGRVQILVGIDKLQGDERMIAALGKDLPANMGMVVFDPGYSTSQRHGGVHRAFDGGSLRTILSYLAHAPYVAYLDDDNSWTPDHLASLHQAIQGHHYAYSLRRFMHPNKTTPVIVDRLESVGPDKGVYANRYSGFVDPNCLMLNIKSCLHVLPFWTRPLENDKEAMSADRVVFGILAKQAGGASTGRATVDFVLHTSDPVLPLRIGCFGYHWVNAEMAALKKRLGLS